MGKERQAVETCGQQGGRGPSREEQSCLKVESPARGECGEVFSVLFLPLANLTANSGDRQEGKPWSCPLYPVGVGIWKTAQWGFISAQGREGRASSPERPHLSRSLWSSPAAWNENTTLEMVKVLAS